MPFLSVDAPPSTQRLADADVAPLGMLLADSARVAMLWAVSDGRALPAGELSRAGRVSPSAASAHLARLVTGGLLSVERHGRHRYYRLVNPAIVNVLEAMATVAEPVPAKSLKEAHAASAIRLARTCYDHLAGVLGVSITDALLKQSALILSGREYIITDTGVASLAKLGIDVHRLGETARRTRRPVTRACLDWSERRYHIAGALGATICSRLLELQWLERQPATRALRVTNEGRRALRQHFDVIIA
ncbi:MAG: MarR family transcriptional regulator [bacterium]